MQLRYYDVAAQTDNLVHDFANDFPTYAAAGYFIWNGDEGETSENSRYWIFMIGNSNTNIPEVFTYDKTNDVVLASMATTSAPNAVYMSKSGNYAFVGYDTTPMCYSNTFTNGFSPMLMFPHVSFGYDKQGNEIVFFMQQTVSPVGNWTDTMQFVRLDNQKAYPVIYQGDFGWNGSNINLSCPGIAAKGWGLISTYGQNTEWDGPNTGSNSGTGPGDGVQYSDWADNQLMMVELDETRTSTTTVHPRLWRVGFTQNICNTNYYFDQPNAAITTNGQRIYWTSDWRNYTTGAMEVNKVDLPAHWYTDLGATFIDTTPPYTAAFNPPQSSTGVAVSPPTISFQVLDDSSGVDVSSLVLSVNGSTVFNGVSPHPYTTVTGTSADYTVTYTSPANFNYSDQINVTINAKDLAGNIMPQVAYSFTVIASSVISAPSNLTAAPVSSSTINLAWTNNATNETGFQVWRSTYSGGEVQIAVTTANVVAYCDPTLSASSTYYYQVRAINAVGSSPYSNEASTVTYPAWYMNAPANLTAIAVSSSTINLAWTNNSSNDTGFKIERSTVSGTCYSQIYLTVANAVAYSDPTLSASSTYYYRIRATNAGGDSAYSNEASTATYPPPFISPPSNLTATPVSSTTINLAWTNNASNETGFQIWRSTYSGGEVYVSSTSAVGYVDPSLSASTTYYYQVRAINAFVNSAFSNEASTVTYSSMYIAPPSSLTAAAVSSSTINLAWANNASNETGFQIWRSTVSNNYYVSVTTVTANIFAYSDHALSASITYYYQVDAFNSGGNSAYSNVASTETFSATLIYAPSNLTVVPVSSSTVSLTWTDNSSNEAGFVIQRSFYSNRLFSTVNSVGMNFVTYTDTGLAASSNYYYRVYAYNANGNSAYSNVASTSTYPAIPAAPSNLTATAVSSAAINLAWTDNSTNETGFKIERSIVSGSNYSQIYLTTANVVGYTDAGLSAQSMYYYRVRATNAGGDSAYSNVSSTITYPLVPLAPSNLAATAVSSSAISLAWTDNSANETGFKVERSTVPGSNFNQIFLTGAGVAVYTDTALSASTSYYYRVKATNAGGDSACSNVACTATYTVWFMCAPSNLTATAVSSSTITLAWISNSNNDTGFKIERKLSVSGVYSQITTAGANATNYADAGLNAGATYYYRVKATNAYTDSFYSNETSTVTYCAVSSYTIIMDRIKSGGIIVIGSTKNRGVINPDQGDTAKIYFQGSQTGKYECRIFSLTGILIWQDTQDNVSSGMFEWIPKNTSSGGYVASIKGPGLNVTKKIAVLR